MRAEMRALRLADAVVTVDTRLYRHVLRLVPETGRGRLHPHELHRHLGLRPRRSEGRGRNCGPSGTSPPTRWCSSVPAGWSRRTASSTRRWRWPPWSPPTARRFLLLHAGEGGERPDIEQIVRETGLEDRGAAAGRPGPRRHPGTLPPGRHRAGALGALRERRGGDLPLGPRGHGLGPAADRRRRGRSGRDGGRRRDRAAGAGADERALAAAILRLAADPALGAALAARARDYVVANHSHTRAAAAYAEVYQSCSEGSASPGRTQGAAVAAVGASMGPAPSASPSATAATPAPARGAAQADLFAAVPQVSVLGFPLHLVDREQAAALLLDAARSGAGGTHPHRRLVQPRAGHARPGRSGGGRGPPGRRPPLPRRRGGGVGGGPAGRAGTRAGAGHRAGRGPARRCGGGRSARLLPGRGRRRGRRGRATAARALPRAGRRRHAPRLLLRRRRGGRGRAVRDSGAVILLVALGAPRQEIFLHRHREELGAAVALGVGGSFDVWAGRVERAPEWTQTVGVEWLYRLATDPRRVRRQLALPRFAWRVVGSAPTTTDPAGPGAGVSSAIPVRRHRGLSGRCDSRRRPRGYRVRYLISGYYGEGNAGDEAILAGILQETARRDADARFTVLSFDPDDTRRRHGVEPRSCTSLRSRGVGGRHAGGRSAHQRRRQLPPRGRLRRCTAGRSCFRQGKLRPVPYFLSVVLLARASGCRSCGTRRGWDRCTPAAARRLVAAAGSVSQVVTWRDPDSARLADEIGVRAPVQLVVPDPAYVARPSGRRCRLPAMRLPHPTWPSVRGPGWGGRPTMSMVAVALGRLLATDALPTAARSASCPSRTGWTCRCARRWPRTRPGRPCRRGVGGRGARALAAHLGGAVFAVTMRLHAGILAAAAGTPAVVIDYDPKVRAFAAQTGQADFAVTVDDLETPPAASGCSPPHSPPRTTWMRGGATCAAASPR